MSDKTKFTLILIIFCLISFLAGIGIRHGKHNVNGIGVTSKYFARHNSPPRRTGGTFSSSKVANIENLATLTTAGSKFPERGDVQFGKFLADFIELSRNNSQKGLEILQAFQKGRTREDIEMISELYARALAESNPSLAIQWATAIEDSIISNLALQSVFSALIDKDAVKALELINPYKDRQWANSVMSQCLQSLAIENPDSSFEWIDANLKNYPSTYYSTLSSVLASVGSRDPDQLIAIFKKYDFGQKEGEILQSSMFGMASLNFESALKFSKKLADDSPLNEFVLRGLCNAAFTQNPDDLTALVMKKNPTKAVDILVVGVSQWVNDDIGSATKWLNNQHPELQKALLLGGVAATAAATNPLLTTKIIGEIDYDPEVKIRIYGAIANQWGETNPGESLKWITSFGERDQVILIEKWLDGAVKVDPGIVRSFLDASPALSNRAKVAALVRIQKPSDTR